MIFYFIKFFQTEEYANQFIAGSLHLNTLKYFKDIEDKSDDGRADSTEAISLWLQPHDVRLTITAPSVGVFEIPPGDLAAPLSVSYSHYDHLHILCLYAVHMKGMSSPDGRFHGSPDEAARLRDEWRMDSRCLKFGRFAVIIPAQPFINQLRRALDSRGLAAKGRLVEYYDENKFHGEIPVPDVPFKKQKRFSYQREFRLCVYTRTETRGPLTLDIGSLSAICTKVESVRLPPQLMELKAEEGS